MSVGFEAPSYDSLLAEQAFVQAEKFQGRVLDEYNRLIFPGQRWREPRGSAVVDFVRPIIGDSERATLDGVIMELAEARHGKPIHWVDMGGGRALAMRQIGTIPDIGSSVKMTNVDLFNFGLEGVKEDEIEYLESLVPGMTKPETEPVLITDNIETVKLPEPADVITSVEAVQYLNNPLLALTNWYNQLADNGIMFVATNHDWSSWIQYERRPKNPNFDITPTKHFLEEMSNAGINFAVTLESDWQNGLRPDLDPNCFRIMAIQKKPGTSFKLTPQVADVVVNPFNFKIVFYPLPAERSQGVLKISSTLNNHLGRITVRDS